MQKSWLSRILRPSLDEQNRVRLYEMERVSGEAPSVDGEEKPGAEDRLLMAEREAYEKGRVRGEQIGRELGEKKLDDVFTRMMHLLEELGEMKRRILMESEKELLDLAVAIAEKIIHQEISLNREIVVGIVKIALKKVVDREVLRIRVNPLDFEVLNQKRELISSLGGVRHLTIEEDDTITPGGCLIEANGGEIDARLETQREEIIKEFGQVSITP